MASMKITLLLASLSVVLLINGASSYPAIDIIEAYDAIGVCVNNCAQCKKMLGSFFQGQLCADSCVEFRGREIPDCENIDSITPFLNSALTHDFHERPQRSAKIPRRQLMVPN